MDSSKQLLSSQKIFQQQSQPTESKVKFLLCVDMDSKQVYTVDLRNHKIYIEQNVPSSYRIKAEKDILEIKKLIQLPGSNWNMNTQRNERYRRRQVSEYLLHKIVNQEPTYLAQSSMSDAFSNVSTLKLLVDLTDYLKLEELEAEHKGINPLTIELHVDLVTCADEVIKKILRAVYNMFQIRLKPKQLENQFILQISGFREYLSGNYSILSYDRVRMSLRGIQYLQVNLTETPKIRKVFANFPPIFERTVPQKGNMSPIPWDEFLDVPCFLFYAPYPLPPYEGGDPVSLANLERLTTIKKQEKAKQFSSLRPRVFMKDKCLEFLEIRRKQIDQQITQLGKQILYSGECDFSFSIQIVGITDIQRILILDDKENDEFRKNFKRRATYNGLCPPRYITKSSAKQEEQHNTSKKKAKIDDDNMSKKKSYFRLSKPKDPDPNFMKMLTKQNFSPHLINHGGSGCTHMDYLQQRYELDVSPYLISIQVLLMYGQTPLTKYCVQYTDKVPFRKLSRFDKPIKFHGLKISQLPMELRVCFNIIVHSVNGEDQIIGSTVTEAFDENGQFKQGRLELNIWPFYKIDSRIASVNEYYGLALPQQQDQQYYSKLVIGFPKFLDDMYWSLRDEKCMSMLGFPVSPLNRHQLIQRETVQTAERRGTFHQGVRKMTKDWKNTPTTEEIAQLDRLLKFDPLTRGLYTDEDKFILLKCRNHYKNSPQAFPIFLCAIDWSDPDQVREVYQMMKIWSPLPSDDALPLLDANISDELVRYYATKQVGLYKDDELVLFMLELTQCLMFEQCHFSPLGEMLIERSIMNPWVVGHELFWQLRSQLHIQYSYERYSLLLEQIMMLFGNYRYELLGEVKVNDEIMEIAENCKLEKDNNKRLIDMRTALLTARKKFFTKFQYAIDPRMSARDFFYDKCKILDSKKLPLWLTMKSAELKDDAEMYKNATVIQPAQIKDPEILKTLKKQKEERTFSRNEKTMIIYKCGDDIRQDLLTLQLIKIMDKIWLDFGMDYRMKPYRVISTLDQVGMIEVVLNSETTSKIHEDAGKFGALNKSSIMEYLKKHNKNNMENAVENFLRSCAGYCVATYVLGIGDRHSGNIMLTEYGHLFHIDFGHFLGNFKTKYGFKRERTPFVFTQEMVYVMGGIQGQNFQRFEEFCTKAYNQIRKHSNLLINIFLMNLSAGMPELQEVQDVEYLKEKLQLDIGDQQATELFRKEIITSLNDMWRKIDNLIHNLRRTGANN